MENFEFQEVVRIFFILTEFIQHKRADPLIFNNLIIQTGKPQQ